MLWCNFHILEQLFYFVKSWLLFGVDIGHPLLVQFFPKMAGFYLDILQVLLGTSIQIIE